MGQVLYEISRRRLDAPSLPIPSHVDVEKLKKSVRREFPDGELVLATLPIGEVGARSGNNELYGRRSQDRLISLVKAEMPEGNWGHIKESELSTKYEFPDVKWLDAVTDANGISWGLALAMTQKVAQWFETAEATNSKVGTSIFAHDVVRDRDEVVSFDRLRIDLADPTRVGVKVTAAVPRVRREMESPEDSLELEKEVPMSETKPTTPPATPPVTPPSTVTVPAETFVNESTERGKLRNQITELQQQIETLTANGQDIKALRTLLGLKADDDVVTTVTELHRKHKEVVAEQTTLMQEYIDDRVSEAVGTVKDAKGMVMLMVKAKNPLTKAEAQQAVTSVLEMAEVKAMLKTTVQEQSGGNQSRPPQHHEPGSDAKASAIEQFLTAKPKGA